MEVRTHWRLGALLLGLGFLGLGGQWVIGKLTVGDADTFVQGGVPRAWMLLFSAMWSAGLLIVMPSAFLREFRALGRPWYHVTMLSLWTLISFGFVVLFMLGWLLVAA